MKSSRIFLLAAALFVCQAVSAQNYRMRTYTDLLGNQITEYRDNYGRIMRTESVTRDVLGNTVVTVRDQYGRQVEQITYETNIIGDTIITIRDGYGAFVEQIIYSRENFGRVETSLIYSFGPKIKYKESRFYLDGRRYGHYNRYFNQHRRPHKLESRPPHKPQPPHRERPRHQLQRPPQGKPQAPNHNRPPQNRPKPKNSHKRESAPHR